MSFETFLNKQVMIIAELSANHNQDRQIAINTIRAAKRAGADAIKLQTYTPDTLTIDCDNDYFKIKHGLWKDKTLYELYQQAYTPWEWQEEMFMTAKDEGLVCFSTPFDKTAVNFLEKFDPPAYKISSFEIQDIELIKYAASKGRPMILSTGIAELEDIELAVKTCKDAGNDQIILLKCTSCYPSPVEEANLATIPDMAEKFKVVVGLSDHSTSITLPVVAVTLGAKIIEKHFILNKFIDAPDAAFSLDEKEFAEMVKCVREAEQAIGKVSYELSDRVRESYIFGRSLFVVKDVKCGEVVSQENVRSIRPRYGLHPKYLCEVFGKKFTKDIKKGSPFYFEMIK